MPNRYRHVRCACVNDANRNGVGGLRGLEQQKRETLRAAMETTRTCAIVSKQRAHQKERENNDGAIGDHDTAMYVFSNTQTLGALKQRAET